MFGVWKVSIKYVESEAVCDNFEKLQECQAQRAIDRANVEWGYFTETAPHIGGRNRAGRPGTHL